TLFSFLLVTRPPPRSPLFPYTTLFRSLFARGATSDVQFPAAPASVVRGVVLEAACSWREVEVRSMDATPPRARVVTTVVHRGVRDRKSTRLNSSHVAISYAVFCLKKKN